MKRRRALASANIPRSFRLQFFAVAWLLADRIGLPQWGWGVFWTIAALLALVTVVDFFTAQDVELPER